MKAILSFGLGAALLAAAGSAYLLTRPPDLPPPTQQQVLEEKLAGEGMPLRPFALMIPEGATGARFVAEEACGFYLRHPGTGRAKLFRGRAAEVYVWDDSIVLLDATGRRVFQQRTPGWEMFELVDGPDSSVLERTLLASWTMEDRFMRKRLSEADEWQVVSGQWRMEQHGGGMATNAENASAQRAVNPFTLKGRSISSGTAARLAYTRNPPTAANVAIEARVKLKEEPGRGSPIATFWLAQGDGERSVRFGWDGDAWELAERRADGWAALGSWKARPPLGNWARLGLGVEHGMTAIAMLDGVELGRFALQYYTPVGLALETESTHGIEVDDVRAYPLRSPAQMAPVFVASAAFSEKQAMGDRDPVQFEYWARGLNTYIQLDGKDSRLQLDGARARVRLPLFGDFVYRSQPDFPPGRYEYLLLAAEVPEQPSDVLHRLEFIKESAGSWRLPDGGSAFMLEFGRRGDRFYYRDANIGLRFLGGPYQPAVFLLLVPPHKDLLAADRHDLRSANVWHELFEQAPTAWYWLDGDFGMNVRWACQPGWNFMAGKSALCAPLQSKRSFRGDQVIDAYLSLRATLPGSEHYYIRRDLNVSFCTDGRDLGSGYSVMFGAENNRVTQLRRKGLILAETTAQAARFPVGVQHQNVHWKMWHFECRKEGPRILIRCNGEVLFDVVDSEPLPGGHLALWSVSNGFTVSRVTVASESSHPEPASGWIEPVVEETGWKPYRTDTVSIRKRDGKAEVENLCSGGPLAVWRASAVNLQQTPILELPLDPGACRLSLHIHVDNQTYVLPITAPTGEMMTTLAPNVAHRYSRRHLRPDIGLKAFSEQQPKRGLIRLDVAEAIAPFGAVRNRKEMVVLTVGNSSNADYLLAGIGGNGYGAKYVVGEPVWLVD